MNESVDSFHQYATLRSSIVGTSCNLSTIEKLKKLFQSQINSNRTYSNVNTLTDLIKVLEKRDYLNKNNLNVLMMIKTLLEPEQTLPNSNDANAQGCLSNVLQDDHELAKENAPAIHLFSRYNALPASISRTLCNPTLKRKVYQIISTEIGRKWIDFGRNLKVSEHYLDELEENYKRIQDRVHIILAYHEEECDARYWKSKLLDALVDARRQDLKKKVQDIFDMYNT